MDPFLDGMLGDSYSWEQISEWDGQELYRRMYEVIFAKLRNDQKMMTLLDASSFQLQGIDINENQATVTYVVRCENLLPPREEKIEMIRERGKWWVRIPEKVFMRPQQK